MQYSWPICRDNDLLITKTSFILSHRSIPVILNLILTLVLCIFVLCVLRFVRQEKSISIIETDIPLSLTNKPEPVIDLPHRTNYYDYEHYLVNNTLKIENKTRRYYYIDLGCFDGRDIDYFVHFHLEEISRHGTLNIIAFEPDPINFASCKMTQEKYTSIKGTVYDTAVWIENGRVRYATEKGQKSKIDQESALYVRSIDFSKWLANNFQPDDFVYVKFTIEGVEIAILEKMVVDRTLSLVDFLEIEWNDGLSPDLEPRRVVLECMFDNFGMDFLYMISPGDLRHAYNVKDSFTAVPKDKGWKLKDPFIRFHYRTRKEVPDLLAERLRRKQQFQSF